MERRDGTAADVISVPPHERDREGEGAPAVVFQSLLALLFLGGLKVGK